MRHASIYAAIFAACALLLPAAGYARESNASTEHAYYEAEPTRYEYVLEVAERTCPAARTAQVRKVMDAGKFMTEVGNRANFTTDEQILLKNYCLMWIDGVISSR
jgi:hypothetical protein